MANAGRVGLDLIRMTEWNAFRGTEWNAIRGVAVEILQQLADEPHNCGATQIFLHMEKVSLWPQGR